MRIIALKQDSPEWHAWRRRGLGASDAPIILGVSPWTTPKQLWEEKVLGKERKRSQRAQSAMQRGKDLEPHVRQLYSDLMGFDLEAFCAEHSEFPWLRASMDGWNAALRTSVEIKCPNRDDHQKALDKVIPEKYLPQCDHQMIVSDSVVHHYVSFNDYFPKAQQLAIVPYERNNEAIAVLLQAEQQFWEWVVTRVYGPDGTTAK